MSPIDTLVPRLELRSFSVLERDVRLVANLDLSLAHGSFVALVGTNGSGKSSLIAGLAGLLETSGEVLLDGCLVRLDSPAQALRAGIALCPADRGVFPRLTVEENLAVGGYILPAVICRATVREQIERFPALVHHLNMKAGQLSGGERQQLSIARALMTNPRLLLLDEPSRGLSPAALSGLVSIFRSLTSDGTTVIVADQALDWLHKAVDRLLIIADGRLTADVNPGQGVPPDLTKVYFDLY